MVYVGRVLDAHIEALCEVLNPETVSNQWHVLIKEALSMGLSPHEAEAALAAGTRLLHVVGGDLECLEAVAAEAAIEWVRKHEEEDS